MHCARAHSIRGTLTSRPLVHSVFTPAVLRPSMIDLEKEFLAFLRHCPMRSYTLDGPSAHNACPLFLSDVTMAFVTQFPGL